MVRSSSSESRTHRVPHSDSSDSFRDSEVLRVANTRVPHIIHPGDLELRVTDTRVPYNIF